VARERVRARRVALVTTIAHATACIAPPLESTRLFLFESVLRGLPDEYKRVATYARQHRNQWPLLTDRVHFGSILSYVYDVPTVVLFGEGPLAFERGEFIGGLAVGFHAFDLRQTVNDPGGFRGRYLEQGDGHRPSEVAEMDLPLEVGTIVLRTIPAHRLASL
jgi:hypothetical protein